jgi:hypothetical protein
MKVDVDGSVSEGMGTGGWGFMIPLLVLVLVGWATMVVQFTFSFPLLQERGKSRRILILPSIAPFPRRRWPVWRRSRWGISKSTVGVLL